MPVKYEKIPHDDARDRSAKNRILINLRCDVRQGNQPWITIRLENISPKGFRINALPGCHPDMPLQVRVPGIQLLTAYIRWQNGGALGCEFSRPLHVAVFEHIVRRAISD